MSPRQLVAVAKLNGHADKTALWTAAVGARMAHADKGQWRTFEEKVT